MHYSFCVLKFKLPARKPDFAKAVRNTSKVQQALSTCNVVHIVSANIKMEAVLCSKDLIPPYQTTRCHI